MNQPAELLAHDEWLRPMVRSLVAAHDVDDVLQDTWLAAVRRPPASGLKKWLAVVARNFALLRHRRDHRRRRRETLAASSEAMPSTAETVQKLSLQAAVAKAVSELAEPYREAVILRFHHGLSHAEVAKAQGIRMEAAKQRVSRGLAQLRARLAEEGGSGWQRGCAVALLLARPSEVSRPLFPIGTGILGVWIMKKSIGLGIAALVLVSTLVFVAEPFGTAPQGPAVSPVGAPMAAKVGETGESVVADPPDLAPDRTVLVEAVPEKEEATLPPFTGVVLDTSARPLQDVEVLAVVIPEAVYRRALERGDMGDFEPVPEPIDVSGPDGRFSFEHDGPVGRIAVGAPFALLRAPDELVDREDEIMVIATPAATVAGIVSDREGTPMADVTIDVVVPDLVDFPLSLDTTTEAEFESASTARDGRFSLEGLPGNHSRLVFRKPGYERATLDVIPGVHTESVVLHPLKDGRFTLIGTVTDPSGRPVAEARVGIDRVTSHADRLGSYRLELDEEALSKGPLYASSTGMQTWLRENPRSLFGESSERQLDIVLAGEAMELSGRVVDPEGVPQAGFHVRLWVEKAIVGAESAADLAMVGAGERRNDWSRPPVYAITGSDGSFTLGGLQDKDYQLRLRHDTTYLAWTEGPFRAGRRDLTLVAPLDKVLPELRGRVVGLDGSPVQDVKVSFSVQVNNMPPSNSWSGPQPDGTPTDANGGFIFEDVPIADDVLLVASGDDVIVRLQYFSPEELLDEVVLTVYRRCNFRVELTRPGAFTRIQMRDGNDEIVQIWEHRGGSNYSDRSFPLTEGKTPIISTSESVQTLVFLGPDGEEMERMPVRLVPGRMNLIQW